MAAVAVGSSVLGAFLQVLFDRMATPEFLNLFRERKGDAQLLNKLKSKLKAVRAVLDDAENKETANQGVKEWLDDLQHTVLEAEDLLDKINTEALRVKVETGGNNPICSNTRFSSSSSSQNFLDGMMPQIKEVVDSLEGFEQSISHLGFQVSASKRQSIPQQPSTCLADDDTFGRDDDQMKIVEMLLSDDVNGDTITVVPIVGLGGVGKTTLAQLVYQDERVREYFPDIKAWICVSDEHDATRITKDLLTELKISFFDSESFNSLQVKLRNALKKKKFLLVLDDVWNRNYNDWDDLRIAFKGGLRGSKIIVTTQDWNVARMMGKEQSIHHLNFISNKDSWSLFKKHAFETKDGRDQNPELEEIGEKIVNKCGGLPLALKTVAGILRDKTMPDEWKDVLTSEVWSRTDNQNSVLPALRLSYMHLPSYLKRCFAYCAVFPKDYNFEKEEVIQLWLANDLLVRPGDNRPTGNIGEECFRELRSRSLFQLAIDNSFSMHDLVNDLARSVFGKYCLRLEDYNPQTHGTIARLKHFSYILKGYGRSHKFKLLEKATDLRTFLPLNMDKHLYTTSLSDKFLHDMLPKFKSLRTLSLAHYNVINLSDSLKNGLKQLRFLDLSYTLIRKLPEWICTLYNLQTLLLAYCHYLTELPVDFGKLINLCYLDISGFRLKKMPTNIGRSLKNLRLTILEIGKDSGPMIEGLGKFDEIGKWLELYGLKNVACGEIASMAKIKSKKQLEGLTLEWGGNANDSQLARDVLQSLEPPSTIKYLKIKGYDGTRFPDWVGSSSFCHVKSLILDGCLNCFELPALGQLQCLESLEIVGMSKLSALTREMYGDISETKPFPSLKKFTIKEMQELERWNIPAKCEAFCSLEELRIIGCPEIVVVGQLPLKQLEILEVSRCNKLVLPELWLNSLPNHLEILKIERMGELKRWDLASLTSLTIWDCEDLICFPEGGLPAPNLTEFHISGCKKLKSLPEQMESLLPSLRCLSIDNCPKIECFPEGGLPSSLQSLVIWGCEKLMTRPREWDLRRLVSLTKLTIDGFGESFPNEDWLLPSTLEHLDLWGGDKVKMLNYSGFGHLTSLKTLAIKSCPLLQSLPDEGLPTSLTRLEIGDCPLLTPRLELGQDLHKVARIPYVLLNCSKLIS